MKELEDFLAKVRFGGWHNEFAREAWRAFIIAAHKKGKPYEILHQDAPLRDEMRAAGMDADAIRQHYSIYIAGIEILRAYDPEGEGE